MTDYECSRNHEVTVDPETGTYELQVDSADGQTILVAAIEAVADVAGVSPMDMEPLGESVDTSMLVGRIETRASDRYAGDPVTVTIHEHEVTIDRDRIHVRPPTDRAER